MKIATILASSQASKSIMLYDTVKRYAPDSEIINFGCYENKATEYSYIEISLLVGLLLASGSVDFVVTGCSSGQGMMLACNSMPGVLCGYIPTPMDAYLFAQINDGNAVSLPLGENYTWTGFDNFKDTIEKLFSEPFGQGYPKGEEERKLKDTAFLKDIRNRSQINIVDLFGNLDKKVLEKISNKKDVISYIADHGTNKEVTDWIKQFADT